MSDYDLPELPSDDELGITDEDKERFEEESPEERPELSQEEMVALLGKTLSPKGAAGPPGESDAAERPDKKPRAKKAVATPKRGRTPVPEGPRSRWRGPTTLALLVAVAAFSSSRTGLPSPVPANASDDVFSSSRAMSMLIEIAREPHPVGSPEHARVRQYLLDRLRSLGLEPEVQVTTSMIQRPSAARAATIRNVVARIPGTDPTGAVLITAHYDSRELAPGAGDDGSGVVTILEALRALRTGDPLRNDLIVLLTDAEELGLLGARAFVEEHPLLEEVQVVLSFEMRGSGGPSIMFETNEENGWVVRALAEFDPHPFANSLSDEVYRRMGRDTDFTPFREAGKQGLNFAAIDNVHVYHQSTDTPTNLSEASLQHHGLRALAGLRHFGQADLQDVTAQSVVYFSVPMLGLFVYGGTWVLPITGGLLVLLALGGLAARRAGARAGAVLVGFLVALAGGAASFAAGLGLLRWVPRHHAEAGSLEASLYHSEGWYVLALACAVFAITAGFHGLARRWLTAVELSLGAVIAPVLLAAWLGIVAPFGAMNVQWPVAAALVSVLLLALLGARAGRTVGPVAALLLAVPVLALLVPVIELLWIAMSVGLAAVLGVLMAVTLQLVLPAIESLRHPNSWWATLSALVLCGSALGMGVLAARPGVERPAPSTLVYAYEHGTGAALWATDPSPDSALDGAAIEWASARAGSDFTETRDLSGFGYAPGPTPVTAAPVVVASPPQVDVTRDSIVEVRRHVELAVRSTVGAELVRFQTDSTLATRVVSINGLPIEGADSVTWVEHWGEPDSVIVLELDMPANEPIGLHVVEHVLRPEALLGDAAFERPEGLAPDVSNMSDRVALRFSVAAFADPRHAFMPFISRALGGLLPTAGEPPDPIEEGEPDAGADAGSAPDTTAVPGDGTSPAPSDTIQGPTADTSSAPPVARR